jgi:hypothetical protein
MNYILIILFALPAFALNIDQTATSQNVSSYYPDGIKVQEDYLARTPGTKLLLVHGFAHCPWNKGSWIYLKDFQINNPDIKVKIIISSKSPGELQDFTSEYKGELPFIFIPSLRGSSESLTSKLGAIYSASFWLFNEKNQLIHKYIGLSYPKILRQFKTIFNKNEVL